MWNPFRKPEPVKILDPLERLELAIDEVNNAFLAMPMGEPNRRIRPYVQSGSAISARKPQVVLGYWTREFGDMRFVVTYGERMS